MGVAGEPRKLGTVQTVKFPRPEAWTPAWSLGREQGEAEADCVRRAGRGPSPHGGEWNRRAQGKGAEISACWRSCWNNPGGRKRQFGKHPKVRPEGLWLLEGLRHQDRGQGGHPSDGLPPTQGHIAPRALGPGPRGRQVLRTPAQPALAQPQQARP